MACDGGCLHGGTITTSIAFDPPLDPVILNWGEQAAGWLMSTSPPGTASW
jgi:hypothetical protein